MNTILIGVFVYIFAQLLIGVLASRSIKSEADYLLAGRSFGYGLASFSIFATWFGAETVVGSAGKMYEEGLSGAAADPFGYALCLILVGLFFAVPLWRRGLTTLADLFHSRYSPGVERLAVLMMGPTSVMWAAAQIRAFGQVISASSELGFLVATAIAAAVVVVYTVYGGLRADAWTDVIQGITLMVGLVILLVVFVDHLGGVSATLASIPPEKLNLFEGWKNDPLAVMEKWAIPIVGSLVAQELVARIIASRTPHIARRAPLIAGGFYLTFGLIPVVIGLAATSALTGIEDTDQVLPLIAQRHLPTFLYILFAGALISAILSTVDSALLAASSLVSHNLILPLRPGMSEAAKVRAARVGVVVFALVAYVLAIYGDSVYELVSDASAFGGAGLFIIIVFGLFSSFGGARSAYAALIVGMTVWVYGNYIGDFSYSFLASLAAAFSVYVLVAVIEPRYLRQPDSAEETG